MSSTANRPRKPEKAPRSRALEFQSEKELVLALEFLEELELTEPVEYSLVPDAEIVVIPTRLFAKFAALLAEGEVPFQEMPVVPLSSLPPEEQARRRGWLRHHSDD